MTTDGVRAFISYAHVDRVHGGQAQRVLAEVGIVAFLAHEDLEVSEEWETRLKEELAVCQLFVPLLSKHSTESVWTQQEAGFIASRLPGVVIAPLSLDGTRSSGFLKHIQSPSVGTSGITSGLLVEPLTARFPRTILPKLIAQAARAGDFRTAETLIAPLVRFFPLLVPDEAEALASAAVENGQIWNASLCQREYLPRFIGVQGSNIKPETLRALQYQLKHRRWYPGDQG